MEIASFKGWRGQVLSLAELIPNRSLSLAGYLNKLETNCGILDCVQSIYLDLDLICVKKTRGAVRRP